MASTEPDAHKQAIKVFFSYQDFLLRFFLVFTSSILPNFPTLTLCNNLKMCGVLTAGTTCSNPVKCMDVRLLFRVCCVGRGLCYGLITRSEESYQVQGYQKVPVHLMISVQKHAKLF
jgi:hypothetical protein